MEIGSFYIFILMKKIFPGILMPIITALFLLVACTTKTQIDMEKRQSNAAIAGALNSSGNFITEKAEFWNRRLFRETEKYLGLDSLDNGFDSIQIRIWYGCALGESRLIILTNKNNKWSGEASNLTSNYSAISKEYDSLGRATTYKEPKSGWENLIFSLFDLKILSLPPKEKIPGLKPFAGTDGCGVGIEVALKNLYRFYQYDNPDTAFQETKNVLSVLRIIEDEFDLKHMFDFNPGYRKLSSDY